MADLARKLCEAVENEDAKEVEHLLNCGADPNLVLSDGIAAIHLASGKESESALRCLTMILQQGGDPNVRSIEELTPVHVAASWGCCKALIFLLRKGGNPSIEDQDGNTALDLALMEKNRRCVVALQEYNERNEYICPDQIQDYYKDKPCEPDEIAEISSISLLLESTYDVSPKSSTKISPFISAPKNGATAKSADDAVLASQIELSSDSKNRAGKCDHEFAGLERSKLHLNDKITNNTSDLRSCNSESEFINQSLKSQNWHRSKNYSSHLYPDITVRNCSSKIKSSVAHVDLNSGEMNNSQNQAKCLSSNVSSQAELESNRTGNIHANSPSNNSSKSREFQFVNEACEGLDVTSPDHVYTYSRSSSGSDMEETLVLPRTDDITEDKGLVNQEISSSSKYTSCFSDGFSTIMESSTASEKEGLISNVNHKSLLDSNSNQMYSQNSGNVDTHMNSDVCSVLNVEDSVQGAVNIFQTQVEDLDNEELSSISAQGTNCKSSVLSSQNLMSSGNECKTARITETLCTSESPTLPAVDTNAHESCSSDLRTRLKDLMLSTKTSGLILKQGNHSLPDLEPEGEFSNSNTISMSGEILPPTGKSLKDTSSKCLNTFTDTLIVESADCENRKTDTELCDLKKMMLATKVIHPVSSIPTEEKSPRFFTERTRSRLLSAKSRHSNSSLFDESLEMPQRGRRLRSPDGRPGSPLPSADDRKNFDQNPMVFQNGRTLENWVPQNNICLVQTPKDHKQNDSESETTVSISNFLTDDLSSEAEVKSSVQLRKTSGNTWCPSSVWLTEDGDTESSSEANHKYVALDSSKQGKALSAASQTGSFCHSTLIEDPAGNSTKVPRYSFSRLSCVPRADETEISLTTKPDPIIEEVHLSPGGRPVNVTHFEPVEYLYTDNEKGHALVEKHIPSTNQSACEISDSSDDTIIYDWRNYSNCKEKINKDSPASTPTRVAVELYRLSNDEIARRLRGLGEEPGQVNSQTRKVCILLLDKRLKEQAASGAGGLSFDYSPELSLALRTYHIPDCNNDEAALSREFDQPDKTRKWREGVLKSSFNYLLLDPRVTRNLPSRFHTLSPPECFRTFVRAVFYVGKGKRARPYCHLYESLTHHKGINKQPCSKVQHILDIWRSGQGVLSLHCFQNTIPVEAYTREACMVDAIGLKMLTNQKKGVYYGQTQSWTPTRRRRLGVHMLHRAMQIFLAEGERQLRPPDIRSGT